ncbi:YCF48-related protein [Pseudomonas sp. RIT-PI-AD]|uniref:WD40/YVTN/BNR-like repeat-containing protein n=1 Tax=Pseudomonas sp. RIT-PI-AD TaxID=3035294 RepID=UPI0021DB686D|nr:YCF48-related protein [Pseudomonas sp. RIT-PI-AD]
MWRTPSDVHEQLPSLATFRFHLPLARVLPLVAALSVLTLFATPLSLHAADATPYAIESPRAAQGLLIDIAHAGARLVAVGERGHILYSDDDGRTWQQAKVPTRQMLTAVYFVDDKHGWAVGHDAQILASDDAGATWRLQFEDLKREAPLLDVWFQDTRVGYAVGAYGALLETTDGGQHWEDASDRLDNEDQYHLNGIAAVKDAGLFIVGEMGSMFRSADGGATWEKIEGPYPGSLFGVTATATPGTLLAYGLRGNLFRSTDFGADWQPVKLKTASGGTLEFGLAGGALLADGTLVIVGHGGSVLQSHDDGASFSVVNRPDRQSLSAVAADAKGNLILVGQGGVRVASPTGTEQQQ